MDTKGMGCAFWLEKSLRLQMGLFLVAAVLLLKQPSTDAAALIRHANERLEAHQRIRDWTIWPGDDFPRTASTLKIKRHEIERQLGTSNPTAKQTAAAIDLAAMSSLERVELLSELENKYQLELDEDSFSKLQSTSELEEWLQRPESATAPLKRETPLSEWARAVLGPGNRIGADRINGVLMGSYGDQHLVTIAYDHVNVAIVVFASNLGLVEHRVQHNSRPPRPDHHHMLAPVHSDLSNAHKPACPECLKQKTVGPLARSVRCHVLQLEENCDSAPAPRT